MIILSFILGIFYWIILEYFEITKSSNELLIILTIMLIIITTMALCLIIDKNIERRKK